MEIIRTYLENMFISLPATPEVIRAKRELLDMMEDKYRELKRAGKSENEAVGTVISEFGNLDELAEALGIETVVRPAQKEDAASASFTGDSGEAKGAADADPFRETLRGAKTDEEPDVTLDIAKQYLKERNAQALRLGICCALCICSPVFTIIADAFESVPGAGIFEAIGVTMLFLMVAAAVAIFIYGSTRMSDWREVRFGGVQLSFQTIEYLREQRLLFKPMYALFLTIGIVLCVISPVPPAIGDAIGNLAPGGVFSLLSENVGAALLLVLVAAGVFFIVYASSRYNAINNLIKRGGIRIDESARTGDTVKERDAGQEAGGKKKKDKRKMKSEEKRFKELWKQTVVCIYLVWSFMTFRWWITWIIFPLSNLAYKWVADYKFGTEGE